MRRAFGSPINQRSRNEMGAPSCTDQPQMPESQKAAAIEWQVKAAKSAKAAMNERHEGVKKAHQSLVQVRSECARYWMGIDDETDQLYA